MKKTGYDDVWRDVFIQSTRSRFNTRGAQLEILDTLLVNSVSRHSTGHSKFFLLNPSLNVVRYLFNRHPSSAALGDVQEDYIHSVLLII